MDRKQFVSTTLSVLLCSVTYFTLHFIITLNSYMRIDACTLTCRFGLVGHRTTSNDKHFKKPLVIVYYGVDYVKNAKGSNYWRNRVIKVAQKFADKDVHFAIANAEEFSHEMSEHGINYVADKVQLLLW